MLWWRADKNSLFVDIMFDVYKYLNLCSDFPELLEELENGVEKVNYFNRMDFRSTP